MILLPAVMMPGPLRRFLALFVDLQFVEPASLDYYESLVDKILAETDKQLLVFVIYQTTFNCMPLHATTCNHM